MVLGAHPVNHRGKLHAHLPAYVLPILAGGAELGGLGAFPGVRLCYTDGLDDGIDEGEKIMSPGDTSRMVS